MPAPLTISPEGPLAAGFAPATEADWQRIAVKALKGAPLESLASASEDGIAIAPLYPLDAAGRTIAGRSPGTPWRIVQRIDHPDPAIANRLAHEAVAGGADTLELVFAGSASAYGAGIGRDLHTNATLLAGLPADRLAFRVDAGEFSVAKARTLRQDGLAGDRRMTIAFDPLATLAGRGRLRFILRGHEILAAPTMGEPASENADEAVLIADGRPWHAAGATAAQELAIVLAGFIANLRALERKAIPLEKAFGYLSATLVTDADIIESIAKLRAWRLLHARLRQASGLPPAAAELHAETAWRMTTRRDPDANILRHGLAAFAAALGGADSITVLPHTAALGLADSGAARIARNTQLVLAAESHLGHLADPTAGSGAVEAMTDALARQAWRRMQAIEAGGGLLAALKAGTPQAEVAASALRRRQRLAAGDAVLVGSTRFTADAPPPTVAPFPPADEPFGEAERVTPLRPAPLEPD